MAKVYTTMKGTPAWKPGLEVCRHPRALLSRLCLFSRDEAKTDRLWFVCVLASSTPTCTYAQVHTEHMCTSRHTRMCTCVSTRTHAYTRTHMHVPTTYMCMHTHAHKHIHTQSTHVCTHMSVCALTWTHAHEGHAPSSCGRKSTGSHPAHQLSSWLLPYR